MDFISTLFDIFLHIDEYLGEIVRTFGAWTYVILFLVIFAETGLVVTPFLPGDSLLFAAGAIAALVPDTLNIFVLILVLSAAAILGDTVNYWIGHWVGPKAFSGKVRFLKKQHLDRTNAFYEKHGGKTIILARFVPIVRTFAPFVAGVGAMTYSKFIVYNVVGGIAWVLIFTLLGYFFGNVPFVQHNFEYVIIAIVLISVLPAVWEFIAEKTRARNELPAATAPEESAD
ncbi:MAG: DedA family protein [Caldilinea sp.]|nr:DedA family protein [Caldilinea sp.]MCB0056460.1 DedA family protein [Caldilineaceae bacterium]MCB0065729.1 DedA family protein [Caldilineaceae bacterium]MCB0138115.1 DedA family protein [Caldilineaceae bacterium]MCB9114287.1 DedA family protein [Caldilineaceae bacterium]